MKQPYYHICLIETSEDMFIGCTATARTLWGAKRKAKRISKLLPSCRVEVVKCSETVAEYFSVYDESTGKYKVYEQYL